MTVRTLRVFRRVEENIIIISRLQTTPSLLATTSLGTLAQLLEQFFQYQQNLTLLVLNRYYLNSKQLSKMKAIFAMLLAAQLQAGCCFLGKLGPHETASRNLFSVRSQRLPLDLASTVTDEDASGISQIQKTKGAVAKLKKVLEREYVSFFDPMQREYYAKDVSFDDPMSSLTGVDAYQNNVDMLASRTLLGKFLFEDAGIVLHSVTGGEVSPEDGSISNIITRWTLRFTFKILPWKPTARFSGISVYEVSVGGSEGVLVDQQTDFWDSINIKDGGKYEKVEKGIAIKDFVDQLKPENANAVAAGPEVPYQLLRKGKDYELRRYPSYTMATIPYERRDEGYDLLATLTKGK